MKKRLYTPDHEWLSIDADTVVIGITPFAQEQLGDLVFVDLPEVGQAVTVGECVVVIESVKAAGEINSPVAGEVLAINDLLKEAPQTVNTDPLSEGWFYKIQMSAAIDTNSLMDEDAYRAFLAG